MTIKRKFLIALGAVVFLFFLVITSFYCVLKTNFKSVDNILIKAANNKEKKKEEEIKKTKGEKGEAEVTRIRQEKEKIKHSKLMTKGNPEITPFEVRKSDGYKTTWEAINTINRITLGLRAMNNLTIDDPSVKNDELLEGVFFYMSLFSPGTFSDLQTLDADSVYYAAMEAMYDPTIRWETKYFICQVLGARGEKRALPLFREITDDNNEVLLLRITAFDHIGIMKDTDSLELTLRLLDDELPIMREKASAILRDITEPGDEYAYEETLSHYYIEEDPSAKRCLLGTVITIGGENSLLDVDEILKIADPGEKETVAIMLGDIHTEASFELLKKLYDPLDKDITILVTDSMAKMESDIADQFLCEVVRQANGIISVMAADDLVKHNFIEAVPYIEEAMAKEKSMEFINNYQESINELRQNVQ